MNAKNSFYNNNNNRYSLSEAEKNVLTNIERKASGFASRANRNIFNGLKICAGAALIAYGMQSGAISEGIDVIKTFAKETISMSSPAAMGDSQKKEASFNKFKASALGTLSGGGVGVVAGFLLKGIGISACGTAIGVPTTLVLMLADGLLAFTGYVSEKILNEFNNDIFKDILTYAKGGILLSVGVALLLDGATRILPNSIKGAYSYVKDGVIYYANLVAETIAATTAKVGTSIKENASTALTSAGVASLAGIATYSYSAANITVLGSGLLGKGLLAGGLIGVPVAPAILIGIGALVGTSIVCKTLVRQY